MPVTRPVLATLFLSPAALWLSVSLFFTLFAHDIRLRQRRRTLDLCFRTDRPAAGAVNG